MFVDHPLFPPLSDQLRTPMLFGKEYCLLITGTSSRANNNSSPILFKERPVFPALQSNSHRRGFSEVAVLKTIQQLEIQAKIKTQILSPNTTYGAYLIMKISEHSFGLDSIPQNYQFKWENNPVCGSTAYLHRGYSNKTAVGAAFLCESGGNDEAEGECRGREGAKREGGWVDGDRGGEFLSGGGGDEEVKMSGVEGEGWTFQRRPHC
ncbi:hypothetical protein Acr_26g0001790 [Actinidia rufa]|uniref:Uncharacterized protein n=1 Tax=Actinidia rufa TaxID=165716 RepID=A0A7J0H1D5_9ERIC|nr:hypothetical protein Acr_26g0001790 [Actinidia rufa]